MTDVSKSLTIADTPTGDLIIGRCRMRNDLGRMAAVIGPPGVGKSVALHRYARSFEGRVNDYGSERARPGVFVTMTADCARTLNMSLELVVRAMESGYAGKRQNLSRTLRGACAKQNAPVVIDEAQYLNAQALDTLRGMWDLYGTPFVFSGNPTFGDRFDREREGALAQFVSRIGGPLTIDGIQRGDVDAIGAANGVTDPDALDVLAFVASRGSLRAVDLTLRTARLMGDAATVPTLRAAALDATGEELPTRLPRSAKILPFKGKATRKRAPNTRLSAG